MIKKITALFVVITLFSFNFSSANAQDLGVGVAKYFEVSEQVETGDIISIEEGEYVKSTVEYDSQIVGVVNLNPAISLRFNDSETAVPVLDSGETLVKVTTQGGNIEEGDFITTSETPGVGKKADRPGFTVGVAKQSYSNDNTEEVQTITISVLPKYSVYGRGQEGSLQRSILDVFSLSAIATYESPSVVFRSVVAALVVLISIVFGFFTFGRIATYGIEAVGRNPLAKRTINLSIIINVAITITIILAGITVAYFILAL